MTALNCGTVETEDFLSKQLGITSYSISSVIPRIIKVQFHIIRRSDGTGGLTTAQVDQALTILRNGFASTSICIVEKGRSFIDNSTFFSGNPDNYFPNIVSTNRHSDAINIYLLPTSNIAYGKADGITTNAYVISGSYVLTAVQVHEFGHCVGLYHTHRGTFPEGGGSQCPELVNGSNSSVCGDLVTDTPADPRIWDGCTYAGTVTDANGQTYKPLTNNFMSYVAPPCLTAYTVQQIARMHTAIANSSTLQAATVRLSGAERICPSGVFTISNPLGTTATWSSLPTGAVSLSGTGNSRTITRTGTYSGQVTISVSYNTPCGTTTISRSVYVGAPNTLDLSVYSESSTVSVNLPLPFVALYPSRCEAITNAEWEVSSSGGNIQYNQGFVCENGNNTAVTISFPTSGTRQVRVRVQNSCGWSGWSQWKTISVN